MFYLIYIISFFSMYRILRNRYISGIPFAIDDLVILFCPIINTMVAIIFSYDMVHDKFDSRKFVEKFFFLNGKGKQ